MRYSLPAMLLGVLILALVLLNAPGGDRKPSQLPKSHRPATELATHGFVKVPSPVSSTPLPNGEPQVRTE